MLKLLITASLISFITWIACTSDESKRKPLNPNGDSELAILMRDMFDEGMVIKQSVIHGNNPELKLEYHHINTATPTEAGKNVSLEYQLFAKAYEASIERFKNGTDADRPAAYQNMVDNCMNCHRAICPGPMVRIQKMYLSENEKLAISN